MTVYAYDFEVYPNYVCAVFINDDETIRCTLDNIRDVLREMNHRGDVELVGFNNVGYDEHILNFIIENPGCSAWDIYNKSCSVIQERPWPCHQHYFKQIDLYKIHHFDNKAKATSLKVIEFNMHMDSIQDLPYPPGAYLDADQQVHVLDYNEHDALATWQFYKASLDLIDFRRELGDEWINYSNTKLGAQWMIRELENRGIPCIGQTPRKSIDLGSVILPYIKFNDPSLVAVHDKLASSVITETKGVFSGLSANIEGFSYDFGTGGIHGSRRGVFTSDSEYLIYDWDVASFYPNLAIVNRFFPAHLGEKFCDIYQEIYEERKNHTKGSVLNKAIKESLNATYGNSNNEYSPFYDPKFTMSITINGQLLLCMLSESLLALGCHMIQINTDGLTVKCPVDQVEAMHRACADWERLTGLTLESAVYSKMFVRDVNNYVAVYDSGAVKLKGAYAIEREWHKNHSALVVPKAAAAYLLHGTNPVEFILGHNDPYDFMMRVKVSRSDSLEWGGQPVQRVTRYYATTDGCELVKTMPPLLRMTYIYKGGDFDKLGKIPYQRDGDLLLVTTKGARERAERHGFTLVDSRMMQGPDRKSSIEADQKVTVANNFDGTLDNVDYRYYIERVNKLIEVFE